MKKINLFVMLILFVQFGCDAKKAMDEFGSASSQKALGELIGEKEIMQEAMKALEKTPEVESLEQAIEMVEFQQTVEQKLEQSIAADLSVITPEEKEIVDEVLSQDVSEIVEEETLEQQDNEEAIVEEMNQFESQNEVAVTAAEETLEQTVQETVVDLTYSNLSDFNFNNQDIYENPVDISGSNLSQNEELPYYQLSWNEVQYNEETIFPHEEEALDEQWKVAHESSLKLADKLLSKLALEETIVSNQQAEIKRKMKNKKFAHHKRDAIEKKLTLLTQKRDRIKAESKNMESKKERFQKKILALQSEPESDQD